MSMLINPVHVLKMETGMERGREPNIAMANVHSFPLREAKRLFNGDELFFFLCAFALVVLGGGDNVGWQGDPTKPMVFCLQGCSRAGGSAVSPRAISCTAGAWRAKFHSSIDHRADAIHRARPPARSNYRLFSRG
uniref:Uncharacterized protein n=1 Tax=Oryza barthii TaxID=65489 RepID=A0A0D3FEF9_9ORYZ